MPIPAYTVIEKTPVNFESTNCDSVVPLVEDGTHDEITNCDYVVPLVEDSTHDVKPVGKKFVAMLLLYHLVTNKILNRMEYLFNVITQK